MAQVVVLTCQLCGIDFPAMGGGVCGSCRRTLCASHYGRPDDGSAAEWTTLRCDDCKAAGTPQKGR